MGYIAWALNYCRGKTVQDKYMLGQDVITELIEKNVTRSEAYLAQWSIEYKIKKDFGEALNIAEQLFLCATDFQSS